MRAAGIAALLMALCGASSAEEFDCDSVVGEPPVSLDIATRFADGEQKVVRAAFQIEGDIGYATDATEPTSLATVADALVTSETLRLNFHYRDANYDGDVATVHLVTLSNGAYSMTAGVLNVVGGGLWTMLCSVSYAG